MSRSTPAALFSLLACALLCLNSAHAQVPSIGLVGYYPFDDNTADDKSAAAGGSSSANNGAWTGTSDYLPGAFGNAARVGNDAGSNFITADGGEEYDFGAFTSFTVVYWINTRSDVPSDPAVVAGGGKDWSESGGTPGWVSFIDDDDVASNVADGTDSAETASIDLDPDDDWNDGQFHWSFVAMVVDRGGQTLVTYVADENVPAFAIERVPFLFGRDFDPDNSQPRTDSLSGVGDLTGGNGTIVIGQDGDLAGYSIPPTGIDDLSIWNRALSRDELWEIYAQGRMNGKALAEFVAPGVISQVASFSPAVDQPLFEAGNVNLFKQFVVGFDVEERAGKTTSVPILGDFGGEIDAGFEAKFGFEFGMCLGGAADFEMNFQPIVMLPEKYPTEIPIPITIDENLLPDSHFRTFLPPLGRVYADIITHLDARLFAEACVFGCIKPFGAHPGLHLSSCDFPPLSDGDNKTLIKESTRCALALDAPRYCAIELASFNRDGITNKLRRLNLGAGSVSAFANQPFVEIVPPLSFSETFTVDPVNNTLILDGPNPFPNGGTVTVDNDGGELPRGLEDRSLYYTSGVGSTFGLLHQVSDGSGNPGGPGDPVDIFDFGTGTHTITSAPEPEVDDAGDYGSISFSVPTLVTNSSDSPETNTAQVLKSTVTKDVLASSVDVAQLISDVISEILPGPLEVPPLKKDVSVGPIRLGYTLAEFEFKPAIQLQMDHEMTWDLEIVDMVFSSPVKLQSPPDSVFPLDADKEVTSLAAGGPNGHGVPAGTFHMTNCGPNALPLVSLITVGSAPSLPEPQPPVQVDVTYRLKPKLRTIVSTPLTGSLPYKILSASASIDYVGGIRLGPLDEGEHKFKVGDFTIYDREFDLESTGTGTLSFTMRAAGPPTFDWNPDQLASSNAKWTQVEVVGNPSPPPATVNRTNWEEQVSEPKATNSYPGMGGPSSRAFITQRSRDPNLDEPLGNPIEALKISGNFTNLNIINSVTMAPADPPVTLRVNGIVENGGNINVSSFFQQGALEIGGENAAIVALCGTGTLTLDRGSALRGGYSGPEPFAFCNYNTIAGTGQAMDVIDVHPAGSTIHNLGIFGGAGSSPIATHQTVVLQIRFDDYPEETTWEVRDSGGGLVASGGPYPLAPDGSVKVETFNLQNGEHTLTMLDSADDGLCCGFGAGSYSLIDEDGNEVASGAMFGASESTQFEVENGGTLRTSAERIVNEGMFEVRGNTEYFVSADRFENRLEGTIRAVFADGELHLSADEVEHAGRIEAANLFEAAGGGVINIGPLNAQRATWNAGRSYRPIAGPPLPGEEQEDNCGRFHAGRGGTINLSAIDLNGGCIVLEDGGQLSTGDPMWFRGTVFEIGTFDAFQNGQPTGTVFLNDDVFDGACLTNYGTMFVFGLSRFENTELFANHGTIIIETGASLWLRKNTVAVPGASENAMFLPGLANFTDGALLGGTWDIAGTLTIGTGGSIKTIGGNAAPAYVSSGSVGDAPGATPAQVSENETNENPSRQLSLGAPAKVTLRGAAPGGADSFASLEINLGELNIVGGRVFGPRGAAEDDAQQGIITGDFCNKGTLTVGPGSKFFTNGAPATDTSYIQRGTTATTTITGDGQLESEMFKLEGGTFTADATANVFFVQGGTLGVGGFFPTRIRAASRVIPTGPGTHVVEPVNITINQNVNAIAATASVEIIGNGVDFPELTDHIVSNAGKFSVESQFNDWIWIDRSAEDFSNTGQLRVAGYNTQLRTRSYTQNGAGASTRIGGGAVIRHTNGFNINGGKLIIELNGRPGQGLTGGIDPLDLPGAIVGPISSFGGELVVDFVDMLGGPDAGVDVGDTWVIVSDSHSVDITQFGAVGCLLDGEPCAPNEILPPGTHLEAVSLRSIPGGTPRGLAVRVVPDLGFITYDDWASGAGVDPDSFPGDPFNDGNGNGFSNATEFLFGIDGTTRTSTGQGMSVDFVTDGEDSFLQLSFVRPERTDAGYVPFISEDLERWEEAVMSIVPPTGPDPGAGLELVTLQSVYPSEERELFLRIDPVLNPDQFDSGELPNDPVQWFGGMNNFDQSLADNGYDVDYAVESGKVLFIRALGEAGGGSPLVWGGTAADGTTRNFIYRDRSRIGQAAVHAGLLGIGEYGILKVTFVDEPAAGFVGSTQNAGTGDEITSNTIAAQGAPYSYMIEYHSEG